MVVLSRLETGDKVRCLVSSISCFTVGNEYEVCVRSDLGVGLYCDCGEGQLYWLSDHDERKFELAGGPW